MEINKTQKEVIVVALIGIIAILVNGLYISSRPNDHDGIIRFHVIANSDSQEDQALKLTVRDRVLKDMEKDIANLTLAADQEESSIEIIRKYVKDNIDKIGNKARQVVKEEGYDYPVTANLGVAYIPEKEYGDTTFPSGNYEALNLVIGKGKGHNWWCVLFPPLCLIDSRDGDYTKELGIDKQEEIVLKSKVAELIQEYENE